jgi:hypothetical protein
MPISNAVSALCIKKVSDFTTVLSDLKLDISLGRPHCGGGFAA